MGPQDLVGVRDEHEAVPRVQRNVRGRREVGGHDDGVVVAVDVKDVDLLAEAVDDVEVVGDPVHSDRDWAPGAG